VLGTDTVSIGPLNDMPIACASGGVISYAARRHRASLGMIRLDTMPRLIAAEFCNSAPNCSTQPPMNAMPYKPKITPPVASVENVLLHASVTVITSNASR
jgi:hypothetical protein